MTPVGTSESDSKDIISYSKNLTRHKKNLDMANSIQTLRVIKAMCERSIKRMECGGSKATDYFMEIF